MSLITRLLDLASAGSESPVRRLIVYYALLIGATVALLYLFPTLNLVFAGERLDDLTSTPRLLQDGLGADQFAAPVLELPPRLNLVLIATAVMLGSLLLMLPVSWVYMAVRRTTGYSQTIIHTMLILPIVVAGIVLVVRNSLALAFGLAGIMAGVQYRNRLQDARDAVFIFLAIGVGLAAGVQALTVAAILSLIFNFVVLTAWRTDYGRSPLSLAPSIEWGGTLGALAESNGTRLVPDRELVLALTPEKATALAERFARVRDLMAGPGKGKKPRYNALLKVTTESVAACQPRVEGILEQATRRWRLDEIVTAEGRPAELYYLVRLRKEPSADDVLSAIVGYARDCVLGAEYELAPESAKG
jgi:hypothetical protein